VLNYSEIIEDILNVDVNFDFNIFMIVFINGYKLFIDTQVKDLYIT